MRERGRDEQQSEFWEQVAGGALLLTYFKELFPRVMELGEVVVNSRETVGARALIWKKMTTTVDEAPVISAAAGDPEAFIATIS